METRSYYSIKVGDWIPDVNKWSKIKSVGIVHSDIFKNGKNTGETRFFISSLEAGPKSLAEAVRGHLGRCIKISAQANKSLFPVKAISSGNKSIFSR